MLKVRRGSGVNQSAITDPEEPRQCVEARRVAPFGKPELQGGINEIEHLVLVIDPTCITNCAPARLEWRLFAFGCFDIPANKFKDFSFKFSRIRGWYARSAEVGLIDNRQVGLIDNRQVGLIDNRQIGLGRH